MAKHAAMTRVAFQPDDYDKIESIFRDRIVPAHDEMKNNGAGLHDHLWLIDRERGEAIGIAVYDDEDALRKVEQFEPHANPLKVRVPSEAPDGYPTQRAEAIRQAGGAVRSSYWYTVVGRD
jgi:hypothetical protein